MTSLKTCGLQGHLLSDSIDIDAASMAIYTLEHLSQPTRARVYRSALGLLRLFEEDCSVMKVAVAHQFVEANVVDQKQSYVYTRRLIYALEVVDVDVFKKQVVR